MSINAEELVKVQQKRNYIQFGGAFPTNGLLYAGQGAQYLFVDSADLSETGNIDPIWVPDPNVPGKYRLAGRKYAPAALPKATITFLEKHAAIPRQLQRIGCNFNLYEATGACNDLSDITAGWTDYVLIYSGAITTDKSLGARTVRDSDNQVEDKISVILSAIYPIGALGFGAQAAAQVERETVDIVYGSKLQCGNCGSAPDDGTQRIYAVSKSSGAGSPGLPGEVEYTLNGGGAWSESQITGIGASADPTHIALVGNYLVVLVSSESAYYYSTLNIAGVPGTWTKVTAGFTTQPNDIFVVSPREVWFCGNSGYVYKSTDITAGVTTVNAGAATSNHLLRIMAVDETIVASGKSSTLIRSVNRGVTFSTVATAPSAVLVDLSAVWALNSNYIWVGTLVSGRLLFTQDGGTTWVEKTFSGSGSGSIRDIYFPTQEVGYFLHDTPTPTARLFSTIDGGADWGNGVQRILNWPTFNKANSIACPAGIDPSIDANNIAIAGLAGDALDGLILIGSCYRL
jgi:hypothetical protein